MYDGTYWNMGTYIHLYMLAMCDKTDDDDVVGLLAPNDVPTDWTALLSIPSLASYDKSHVASVCNVQSVMGMPAAN